MRIADMQVTMVAISDPPLLNAAGLHAPYALRLIVELFSDDGISGLGEIPGSVETEAALNAAREVVIGSDPFQRNALEAALRPGSQWTRAGNAGMRPGTRASLCTCSARWKSPVSTSWARRSARPVCDLLGGRVRDEVPFAAYLFYKYEGAAARSASTLTHRRPAGQRPVRPRRWTRRAWWRRHRPCARLSAFTPSS